MVPRKPKVWCNFSPLAGLETRICQQNKAKWKYGNFKHAGLKKVNAVGYKLEIWKKYSGHFWTTFFWWTVLWSPSPTPCWLCNCQDHLQSSFAQVLGEIRSQSSLAHLLCSAPGFLPCERVHNSPLGPAVSRCGLDSHPHKHPRNKGDDAGSLWVESASLFNADAAIGKQVVDVNCRFLNQSSIFMHYIWNQHLSEMISLYRDLSRWSMVQAWVSCFWGVTLMPFSHCRLWVLPCALGVHLLDLPQEPHVPQANLRHQRLKRQQRWDRRCSICQNPSSTVDGQDLAPVDIEHQRNFHCLYPLETYKVVCLILSINGVEGFASVYLFFFSGDI